MTQCVTNNIIEAVAALKTGNCIGLNANNAGWNDIALFEIIKCINDGYCTNLKSLNLAGNHFSPSALRVLRRVIGPIARTAELQAMSEPQPSLNPQNTS
tara:strand:- start:680 stop:976 length:297 start_codon:yes stop_codon:yes gene_type:complete